MYQKIIIYFFSFFLVSRFFSEVIRVLPKWADIIDIPFIGLVTFLALLKPQGNHLDPKEHKFFIRIIWALILVMVISSAINFKDFFEPAAVLFAIGFLEAPLLFYSLNKLIDDIESFGQRIYYLFFILFVVNVFIFIFIDTPLFISTGNPDYMSGTFGQNPYQFSIFLLICGGFLIGEFELNRLPRFLVIPAMVFIFIAFFLLQYRAGLPFFILSLTGVLFANYGRKVTRLVLVGALVLMVAGSSFYLVIAKAEELATLKYDDWLYILKNPTEFIKYRKFAVYPQTARMLARNPLTGLFGCGPGNYVSRGFYTFSYEMERTASGKLKEGVPRLVSKVFGLNKPRITKVSKKYVGLLTREEESVLGSYQFNSPNSSIIAPFAEMGLVGGGLVVMLYLYLLINSVRLVRTARIIANEYLPLTTAALSGVIYLLGLGFLDNYWEMARATLPVWLLFWTANSVINLKIIHLQNSQTQERALKNNGQKRD